ncbi:MAG: molybdopterin-dependent oxidoreductase [Oligoflexia bacterium]|nr:molybdopterin-dependent oxidoreductase [Oligoflexia bacterium]
MKKVTRRGFLHGSLVTTAGIAAASSTPGRSALAAGVVDPAAAIGPQRELVVVQTTVNGKNVALTVTPDEPVVESLRRRLGLTGTKRSCGSGTCGACTVHLDGEPTCSCLLPTTAVEGRQITTVEGLSAKGPLHPVQRAFMAEDALQCGFCTPGFVVQASAFHDEWRRVHGTDEPGADVIADALAGHLCRCGAYPQIYAAVQAACRGDFDHADPIPPRLEARQKVTGAAVYTVDVQLEGMLYGAVLRSPHGHAVLNSLDLGPAQALPGVKAVIRLVPDGAVVRYADQAIAAVAAVDEAAARQAVAAMVSDYTPRPHVLNLDDAQAPAAPVIWDRPKAAPSASGSRVLKAKWSGNVRGPFSSGILGKPKAAGKRVDAALAQGRVAALTVQTQAQIHTALEPHAAVAWYKSAAEGTERGQIPRPTVELWVSTQAVSDAAEEVAKRWKLRRQDVRVHSPHTGGAFGAKATMSTETLVAVELSKAAGAPVRVVWDRAEELAVGGYRPAQRITTQVAHTPQGGLDALRGISWTNSGVAVGQVSGMVARLLYKSDYKQLDDYDVVTNTPPGKPFRGPGGPTQIFALEQVIDELSTKLGQDPITLRRAWDQHPGRLRLYDWIESQPVWRDRAGLPRQGRFRQGVGVAIANWFTFENPGAVVQIDADSDRILVSSAVQDMGQGARTVLAENVARVMGIRPHDVTVRVGDSADPGGVASVGSCTTLSAGPAAAQAAEQLVQELLAVCRDELGWADAEAVGGGVAHGGAVTAWRDALAATGPLRVIGKRKRDPGGYFLPFGVEGLKIGKTLAAAVQLTQVQVDTWLGRTEVQGVWIGVAAGRMHAPILARSQVQGAVVQGIGYALYEERRMDPTTGQLLTRNMDDYRIAGIGDIPQITVKFDDQPLDGVLGGGIGVGEVCTLPTAASIANAVKDATGWRPTALPLRPDRLLEGLA